MGRLTKPHKAAETHASKNVLSRVTEPREHAQRIFNLLCGVKGGFPKHMMLKVRSEDEQS